LEDVSVISVFGRQHGDVLLARAETAKETPMLTASGELSAEYQRFFEIQRNDEPDYEDFSSLA
jgi:hypothetical protein